MMLDLQAMLGEVAHFVILFFQAKTLSFKGVYAHDSQSG